MDEETGICMTHEYVSDEGGEGAAEEEEDEN